MVADGETYAILLHLQLHAHWFAGSVLHGVGEQVDEELLDPESIPGPPGLVRQLQLERSSRLRGGLPKVVRHLPDENSQIELLWRQLEAALRDPGNVQQAIDEAREALGLTDGAFQPLGTFSRRWRPDRARGLAASAAAPSAA